MSDRPNAMRDVARSQDGRMATLSLPAIGIGCWAFGGGSYWGTQEQGDVNRVVAKALDSGLNYFDSAEAYNGGASEESLGKALRGRRAEALIGTKVSPSNAYPEIIARHCEESLRRLGTDYLDIYMIHWPLNPQSVSHFSSNDEVIRNPPAIGPTMEAMGRLQRDGKIRFVGLSNFGAVQLTEAAGFGVPIAVNEIAYNLLMRAAEDSVLPHCAENGIRTLGYSALMQGLLARPLSSFEGVPGIRLRTRHFSGKREGSRHGEDGIEPETLSALVEIARIAKNAGLPVAEMALGWAMSNPYIDCTLVGCRNTKQLEENIKSLSRPLAPGIKQALDDATQQVKSRLGERIDYFQGLQETRSW